MKKSLKPVLIILPVILLILCVVLFFLLHKNSTTVAFYNVPEIYEQEIKNIISQSDLKIKFVDLDENAITFRKLYKKTDFLIAYNDANVQKNLGKAVKISEEVKNRYSKSINTSQFYCKNGDFVLQPVLLDQFEAGIVKTIYQKFKIENPFYFSQFADFAKETKPYYPIPMVIAGSEDINVNSFFSLFVEAYGGQTGYVKMAEKLSSTTDFTKIYDYKIEGDADENLTVRDLLLTIKEWQSENLLDYKWFERKPENTAKFIDDGDSSVSFMNLSEHRTKPILNGKYYVGNEIPAETAAERFSIQPVIVAVSFKNNETTRIIQNRLSLSENQEILSENTKLGPAALQAEAYDSLANNARFLAASISGGPVPDLGTLALPTNFQRHQLAEAIRNYCKN